MEEQKKRGFIQCVASGAKQESLKALPNDDTWTHELFSFECIGLLYDQPWQVALLIVWESERTSLVHTITDGSLVSTPTEWGRCWQICQRTHTAIMILANISTSQQRPFFRYVTWSRHPVCTKTSGGYVEFFMRVKGEYLISHIFQLKSRLNPLWGCVKSTSVCQGHGFSLVWNLKATDHAFRQKKIYQISQSHFLYISSGDPIQRRLGDVL